MQPNIHFLQSLVAEHQADVRRQAARRRAVVRARHPDRPPPAVPPRARRLRLVEV